MILSRNEVINAELKDYREIHDLIGSLDGLVQHPVHFYNIMMRYFGDSFFVVKRNGTIAGVVWGFVSQADPSVFFLWQIGVSEQHRGSGIAPSLVARLIEHARERGCKKMHVTAETGNIPSWKLFQKMKFKNISNGDTVVENNIKAIVNYYGSGTNQVLFEYQL